MAEQTAEIGVIGAGPAGAFLASRLADAGRDVVLFDPRGAWEKPCGGGVPTRALKEYAWLFQRSDSPRQMIHRVTIISPLGRRITVHVEEPFAIYSRRVLNGLILDRAIESGARFVNIGVSEFRREDGGWRLRTEDGHAWRVGFLAGADGAASPTRRRLVGIFPKQDLALAFGYNVAIDDKNGGSTAELASSPTFDPDEVIVRFPDDFTGYIWAFPRPGVMNFGVAAKLGERTSDELRGMLKSFVAEYFGGTMPEDGRLDFFGAKIPTLDRDSWKSLRTTGENWALVGDAAGFADPITGEGIYYALRSAELLGNAFQEAASASGYERVTTGYEAAWRQAFGSDLEWASRHLARFYHGRFLGRIFTDAMILMAKYHRGVRRVLVRALVGQQSYVTLKRELKRHALRVF